MQTLSTLLAFSAGAALIALMLQDAFEVMLLPRRVRRQWRFDPQGAEEKVAEFNATYEPFLQALARFLIIDLPGVAPQSENGDGLDNWQRSIRGRSAKSLVERSGHALIGNCETPHWMAGLGGVTRRERRPLRAPRGTASQR